MKKRYVLFLPLAVSLVTSGYAQFSAGVMGGGGGYAAQRQVSSSPDYVGLAGVEAVRPVPMIGLYGQVTTRGKRGLVVGLQLRCQNQAQSSSLGSIPPGLVPDDKRYNRYDYVVLTPYVGIRPVGKLEIAAGPDIHWLVDARLGSIPRDRNPAKRLGGYTIKATYWLKRLGLEGGDSRQRTAFDSQRITATETVSFYNSFGYVAVRYNLIGPVR